MNEPNGHGDRDLTGRFTRGNRAALGADHSNRSAVQIRQAVLEAIEPERFEAVIRRLEQLALDGDVSAIKLFLEYTHGKPPQSVKLSASPSVVRPILYLPDNGRDTEFYCKLEGSTDA